MTLKNLDLVLHVLFSDLVKNKVLERPSSTTKFDSLVVTTLLLLNEQDIPERAKRVRNAPMDCDGSQLATNVLLRVLTAQPI